MPCGDPDDAAATTMNYFGSLREAFCDVSEVGIWILVWVLLGSSPSSPFLLLSFERLKLRFVEVQIIGQGW